MDKITITTSDDGLTHEFPVKDLSKVSDGYHTIKELYEHRNLLFLHVALMIFDIQKEMEFDGDSPVNIVYYRKDEKTPGWFILYLGADDIEKQVSYNLPMKYFHFVERSGVPKAPTEYKWDGHTSKDVLKRLEMILEERIDIGEKLNR